MDGRDIAGIDTGCQSQRSYDLPSRGSGRQRQPGAVRGFRLRDRETSDNSDEPDHPSSRYPL